MRFSPSHKHIFSLFSQKPVRPRRYSAPFPGPSVASNASTNYQNRASSESAREPKATGTRAPTIIPAGVNPDMKLSVL